MRIMIGQNIGLPYLVPMALERDACCRYTAACM
jgi:hypothetical protein